MKFKGMKNRENIQKNRGNPFAPIEIMCTFALSNIKNENV
jgi:hypothetical protein